MADPKGPALRKVMSTRDACRKTEVMLEGARRNHRAAILAAVETGIAQREVARKLGVSEVVLREKLARARVER